MYSPAQNVRKWLGDQRKCHWYGEDAYHWQKFRTDSNGPLLKTTSGHQHILVISDYATRFPEAYPLRRLQP